MVVDESQVFETPLVELDLDIPPTVYGKVEWCNFHDQNYGGGSVKSRIAVAMLDALEADGTLPGPTLLEPSSGNTAAALARVGAARGHDVEVVVPTDAGVGKVAAIREAGGRIHWVPAAEGYDALYERRDAMVESGDYVSPDQYSNPANPRIHAQTTGPELWRQTDGEVTAVVAGAGTGGTVTGVARALRQRDSSVRVVGFEPAGEDHALYGLKYLRTGDHVHPDTYDEGVLDDKRYVETGRAHAAAVELADRYADRSIRIRDTGQYDEALVRRRLRVDGEFLVGPSSGGALACVRTLSRAGELDESDVVVVPLADRGDRYPAGDLWGDRLGEPPALSGCREEFDVQ